MEHEKSRNVLLVKVKELSGWLKDQNGRGKFVWSTSTFIQGEKVPHSSENIRETGVF